MRKSEIAILTGFLTAAFGGMFLVESEKLIPVWPTLVFAIGIATALTGTKIYRREEVRKR